MTRASISCVAMVMMLAALTLPAGAFDDVVSRDAPELTAVRAKIKAKDWPAALAELRIISNTVQHADVYSLLGFVNRNMGEHKTALVCYRKALSFDPNHKGAHEYLGELFVKIGDMAQAHEHEAFLQRLCPAGCEELEDLQKAIAARPPAGATGTITLQD